MVNNMKRRIIAVVLIVASLLLLCSCKKSEVTRYDYKMKKYVTLPENISADVTNTDEFKKYFEEYTENAVIREAVLTRSTSAKAEKGGNLGITVKGENTEEQCELTAGDSSFKYGKMADAVIGKKAGDVFEYTVENIDGTTTDVTVTVDYVYAPELDDSTAQLMGYKDKKEAEEKLQTKAADEYIIILLEKNSEIKSYPEKEYTELYEVHKNYYKQLASGYGLSVDEYREQEGMNAAEFEDMLDKKAKETMKSEMPIYAYARAEKIKITQADIDKTAEEIAKQNGGEAATVFEQTPLRDIELLTLKNAVIKHIKEESSK